MSRLTKGVLAVAFVVGILSPAIPAQPFQPTIRMPSAEKVVAAKKMATDVFAKLKEGKSEEAAKWIVQEVGYAWSAQDRVKKLGEFKSSFDLILIGPPDGPLGPIDGFDLIQESYLPGTDRYFRLTYMTYHQSSPLMWEFRFYVKPDGSVSLNQVAWSGDNPFEYLTQSAMLLNQWYGK